MKRIPPIKLRTQLKIAAMAYTTIAFLGLCLYALDHTDMLPQVEPVIPAPKPVSQVAPPAKVDETLMKALKQTESAGKPDAISPKGARGACQLMPATARELGVRHVNNPHENCAGAKRYLARLRDYYQDVTLALMAYNWGIGNVDRWLDRGGRLSEVPQETKDYVFKVNANVALLALAEE